MRAGLLAFLLSALSLPAAAQDLATLLADSVRIEDDATLVAEGNVEVLYDGARLDAARIVYDRDADRLAIEGPITLRDAEGRSLVLAEAAALDADLRDGILTSARLVLDRQLQLAAAQIARVDGRYVRLSNSVASSCEVCAANPVPTWEIRAREVIHDQQERQIYFTDATFRLLGVPVFYLPRLRLPDPSLKRARGFLLPRVRSNSQLGVGFKLPYFLPIGDHADLTLTPYVSPRTRTLEARYREAFANGDLYVEGAVSRDDLLGDDSRYYVLGTGGFDLPRQFRLEFDIESVSDRAYLLDYGYSDLDRLETDLRLSRARRDELLVAGLARFETLRADEQAIEDQLPRLYGTIEYERRLALGRNELRLGLDAATIRRDSGLDGPGRDLDRVEIRTDVIRAFAGPMGLVGHSTLGLAATGYGIDDDSRFGATATRLTPSASAELRWPLGRSGPGGAQELLEPVAQIAWSRTSGEDVPNEDSVLVSFDEGNLFSLTRYPGTDAREEGFRANLGLRYTRIAGEWSLGATLGRVVRAENDQGFPDGVGLDGAHSDWLAAVQLKLGDRVALVHRVLLDDDLGLTLNEARLAYRDPATALASTYLWQDASPSQNRAEPVHEFTLDAARRLSRHWTGRLEGRFDLTQERAANAGLGLEYRSECLVVDLSLSRRFTASDIVEPSTDFGLTVSLAGFGSDRNDRSYRKVCRAAG